MKNIFEHDPLNRFMKRHAEMYKFALQEIKEGKKKSHWMWFIFPQLRGLSKSNTSYIYGIIGINEAKEYLAHPVLGARLTECCEALLLHKDKTAKEIFGNTDELKLRSSMTLFALLSEENSVFHKVLNQFFDGIMDEITKKLLCNTDGFYIENGVLLGYYGKDEDLVIPQGVTAIHKFTFYKNKYLRSITLPESVTDIGDNAFACCYNLQKVTIPSKLPVVGRCAFCCCKKLADENGFVVVKNVLYDCYSTDENIVVPESVTTIGQYAFFNCHSSAKTIRLSEGVTTIEPIAFWRCKSLQQVTIPQNVTEIALNAFMECETSRFAHLQAVLQKAMQRQQVLPLRQYDKELQ